MNKRFSILTTVVFLTTTLLVGSLFGCATITSDSKYLVTIDSTPQEANVTVINEYDQSIFTSKTPAQVWLDSGQSPFKKAFYRINFEKEGYATKMVPIPARIDESYYNNICLLGGMWIGFLIVDPITGAMWELDRNVHATLTPILSGENQAQPVAPAIEKKGNIIMKTFSPNSSYPTFDIDTAFQNDLDNQIFTEGLRAEFLRHGRILAPNAYIFVRKEEDGHWLILNARDDQSYQIKKADGKLTVITVLLTKNR